MAEFVILRINCASSFSLELSSRSRPDIMALVLMSWGSKGFEPIQALSLPCGFSMQTPQIPTNICNVRTRSFTAC